MASKGIELKPCPFCGKEVRVERTPMLWVVHCSWCGAVVSFEPASQISEKATAEAWNRRAK